MQMSPNVKTIHFYLFLDDESNDVAKNVTTVVIVTDGISIATTVNVGKHENANDDDIDESINDVQRGTWRHVSTTWVTTTVVILN